MKIPKILFLLVLIPILLLLPAFIKTPYFIDVLITTGLYVILALSYDLSVGYLGDLSLGHPVFIGAGGYIAAILSRNYGMPFFICILVAIIFSVLLAIAIGYPSFRLSAYAFSIATMGVAIVANSLASNWTQLTSGPLCVDKIPSPVLSLGHFSWTIDSLNDYYYIVLALAFFTYFFIKLILRSRVGRAFIAVREDSILASARGINPLKYRLLAFCTGAAIASVAGVIIAYRTTVVCPTNFSFNYTINLLFMVFIGGSGSLNGVVVGAVIFTIIPEALRMSPEYRMVIYGVILVVMIITVPEGLQSLPTAFRRLRSSLKKSKIEKETKDNAPK
jgi:ABC-type branched-subunit amino acid transport system permease subunit